MSFCFEQYYVKTTYLRTREANTPRQNCMVKTLHAYRICYHNSVVSIIFVHSFTRISNAFMFFSLCPYTYTTFVQPCIARIECVYTLFDCSCVCCCCFCCALSPSISSQCAFSLFLTSLLYLIRTFDFLCILWTFFCPVFLMGAYD